jgi:hypothetical protein
MIQIYYNIEFDEFYRLEDNKFIIPYIDWNNLDFHWDEKTQEWKNQTND